MTRPSPVGRRPESANLRRQIETSLKVEGFDAQPRGSCRTDPVGPRESAAARARGRRRLDTVRPIGRQACAALAIDPSAPQTLYAGTYGGGVFKSTDGGATWISLSPEIRRQTVNAVAIDSSRPQTILVGTYNDGVWKSSDGGSTWKRVLHGGSDVGNQQAPISAIMFDPTNPRIVYAATDTGPNDGVTSSADGGATWIRNTGGLPNNFRIDALGDRSEEPGDALRRLERWRPLQEHRRRTQLDVDPRPGDGEFVLSLAIDPSEPETIFAGTINSGVFKSNDGGKTWSPAISSGAMKGARVLALAIDSSRVLWAGVRNGLLRSTDGGKSWVDTMPDLEYASVGALALDPMRPGVVYAGTTRDGVLKSPDGGKTWSRSGPGLWAVDVTGVASDPTVPQTVWVATSGGGIFRTTDGGASWSLKSEGLTDRSVRCFLLDPVSRTLYAGTEDGVFRSTDGAEHWLRFQSGFLASTGIVALASDPSNPKTVYARDNDSVFKSTDAGANWKKTGPDLEASGTTNGLFALTVVPSSPRQSSRTRTGLCGRARTGRDPSPRSGPAFRFLEFRHSSPIRKARPYGSGPRTKACGRVRTAVGPGRKAGPEWGAWTRRRCSSIRPLLYAVRRRLEQGRLPQRGRRKGLGSRSGARRRTRTSSCSLSIVPRPDGSWSAPGEAASGDSTRPTWLPLRSRHGTGAGEEKKTEMEVPS